MKPIVFLQPAEQEMLEAAQYYEYRRSGLGSSFLVEIQQAVDEIANSPETWPITLYEIRQRSIKRFPYRVLYRNDLDKIVIIAIMHLRRHPDYWLERL
jgi:plasmid stabilization system protein ParE